MGACDELPQAGTFGIPNARLIAPGDAARSVVVHRASHRDESAMPPIGSGVVDMEGVELVSRWIGGLSSCN